MDSHPITKSQNPIRKSRFHYGYIIVVVSFVLMVFGWGIYYIYGVFFGPLESEFGWTRALTSGAFSLSVLISGIVGIAAGRLSDHIGPKAVIMFCTAFLALGYIMMSLVRETWQFYLVYGLIIATGIGGFWAPPLATVARWFEGRRGMMTGIVSGGISFGTLVLPPAVTHLISAYGWRRSYIIIGIAVLIIGMIAAQFLRPSPQHMGLSPYGEKKSKSRVPEPASTGFLFGEAIRTVQFWMVALIYLFFGAILLTVMVHIVPHATGMGYSPISASVVLSIIGGVSLAGRIIMGSVADRLRVKISTLLCISLLSISLIWLQFADSLWQLYLFAVIFGIGYGGMSCLQPLIGAELFGLTALGTITAVISFSFDIGGAAGPVLAGYAFDVNASYRWAFAACVLLAVATLIIVLYLKPPGRKETT